MVAARDEKGWSERYFQQVFSRERGRNIHHAFRWRHIHHNQSKVPNGEHTSLLETLDSDKPVATRKGVAFSRYKWDRLCDTMQVMREFVPELDQACVCYYSHHNELESISCKECSLFEDDGWKVILPNEEWHCIISIWYLFWRGPEMTHRDAFRFYLWTTTPMTSEVWGFFTLTAVFIVVSHNMWKSPINKVRNHLVLLSIKNRHFSLRPKDRLLK